MEPKTIYVISINGINLLIFMVYKLRTHRRSPKFKNQSPNSKCMGFFRLRRSLWNVQPKLKSQKKYCTFFAWNLISMPRGISWHHWKNLLTSKRGHSGGSNFSTEFDQIWLKTSGGSRELIFGPICKCLTISESSWHTAFRFWKLKDLGGH